MLVYMIMQSHELDGSPLVSSSAYTQDFPSGVVPQNPQPTELRLVDDPDKEFQHMHVAHGWF